MNRTVTLSIIAAAASACGTAGACDLRPGAAPAEQAAAAAFAAGIAAQAAGASHAATIADPPIVGMWRFAFVAPDGISVLDWGYQTWHGDGTEITNSGGRPAKNGNFCTGVWRNSGWRSYSLNHWAIQWGHPPDFDENTLDGLVNVREHVTVGRSGDTLSGTVSLDLYATDGTTLLAHIGDASVTGTRVSP